MVAPAAALGADCINLPVCCCFDPLFLHAIHTPVCHVLLGISAMHT